MPPIPLSVQIHLGRVKVKFRGGPNNSPAEHRFWALMTYFGPIHPIHGRCWDWTGTTRDGYGQIRVKGSTTNAHRYSWILHRGEIPTSLQVLHKCDNRRCVNPDHLFLGTNQDNMDDKVSKGRAKGPKGERAGNVKLIEESVREIRLLRANGYLLRELADKFGVHLSLISLIVKRKLWKHVK